LIFDYSEISAGERTNLLYNSVIPRPVAWIVTEEGGVVNIAPFSFFTGVSSTPPVVMVAIGNRKDGSPKDTLRNIRNSQKATICTVSPEQMEKMKQSAESLEPTESEAEKFQIEVETAVKDFPPAIKGSDSAMFCTLHSEIDFEGNTTPLFLRVEKQKISDKSIGENSIDIDVIGRVGKSYALLKGME
jgi:flavin reductase (DIM6/NTAB) family NADH-FMN oxidoreductase RutF